LYFDEGVIISDFQKFHIGIAFVPKVKKGIGVVKFVRVPSHLKKLCVIKKVQLESSIFSHLTMSLPESFLLSLGFRTGKIEVIPCAPINAPSVV
jgi:hypothetical protein